MALTSSGSSFQSLPAIFEISGLLMEGWLWVMLD